MILAFAFWWWFALLDARGLPVQTIERFLTRDDCEWARVIYARIIEVSGRTDLSVGICVEAGE